MSVETIEGEVIDVTPAEIRSVAVIQQPGQAIVNDAGSPLRMVGIATALADALKDIVDNRGLFAVIQGKKYPTVEAWMTIARLDNVVAREARPPERHEDGSYEAFSELIRLSDGMVIGAGSALCGTPDDKPWASRPEPARRSMAVTRATSRAFRQQYSWIMALAGYEPTPAEEMPQDGPRTAPEPRNVTPSPTGPQGRQGTAEIGKPPSDFELRETKDGNALSFRLAADGRSIKVVAFDPIASALAVIKGQVIGQPVTCFGTVKAESFDKDGRTITYDVLTLERIVTADYTLPAPERSADEAELDGLDF